MERVTIKARTREKAHAQPRERISVQPKARQQVAARPINALWERRGWQQGLSARGPLYEGEFRVVSARTGREHTFAGRVETGGGYCQALVRNPPAALLSRHPKRMCFHARGQGWYSMNWWRGTSDVDETISYVEQTLGEALALGKE
jgi:hypothetical protein